MSRRTTPPWLATLAGLGLSLGLATLAQAQPPGMPPVGPPPVGVPGGPPPGVNLAGADPTAFPGYRGQFDYLQPNVVYRPLEKWWYYPYYYFPHSYWPSQGPKWPERPGEHTLPAPAYMSYPPFHEPHWRYEAWQQQRYYRGFHFWLDQF